MKGAYTIHTTHTATNWREVHPLSQGPLRAWWGRSWATAFWPFGTRLTSGAQWNLGILKSQGDSKVRSFQFVSIPEMRITIDHYIYTYIYTCIIMNFLLGLFWDGLKPPAIAVSCWGRVQPPCKSVRGSAVAAAGTLLGCRLLVDFLLGYPLVMTNIAMV